jgi:SAM-dependent methyltransferase
MFGEQPVISRWVADMYDQKVTEIDDVNFMLSILGKQPRKIFEVCCGSGRILVPLAKAGHTVSGMDADEFMLARISEKAGGLSNIAWRKGDVLNDVWGSGYDVVVLAGNILFNIISDLEYEQAQELLIKKAMSALSPGGYVYIDYQPGRHSLQHPDRFTESSGEWVVWEGCDGEGNCGRMSLISGHYDPKTCIDSFTRHFELILGNGDIIRQDIPSMKHFATLEQLHGWLALYGFSIEHEYSDWRGHPVVKDTQRVIIYARKII